MNTSKKLIPLVQTVRNNSTTKTVVRPQFKKLKATQEAFSVPDGVPVHLKGGIKDKALLGITTVGIVYGLVASVDTVYKLIVGK